MLADLQDWVAACDGKCKYDFVAFHYYGTDANDLISYAKVGPYVLPVPPEMLTARTFTHDTRNLSGSLRYVCASDATSCTDRQTACHDYSANRICTEDQVKTFMKTAVDWFEGEGSSMVERWAWFGAFPDSAAGGNTNGLENTDGTVCSLRPGCALETDDSRTRWANTTSASRLGAEGRST